MKRNYQNPRATELFRAWSEDLSRLPFSFVYNGEKYRGFSPAYFSLIGKEVTKSDDKETQNYKFSFLQTLEVSLILTHYISHGVTEWTVWFENISNKNSGVIEDQIGRAHV